MSEDVNIPGFEGPEKTLHIKLINSVDGDAGLHSVSRNTWQTILNEANCQIISSLQNGYCKCYILSESSMLVYPHKCIIKTCGRTTLLKTIPLFIQLIRELGLSLEYIMFISKNYIFPEYQMFPHSNYSEANEYLEHYVKGNGIVLGSQSGDHVFLFSTRFPQVFSSSVILENDLDQQTHALSGESSNVGAVHREFECRRIERQLSGENPNYLTHVNYSPHCEDIELFVDSLSEELNDVSDIASDCVSEEEEEGRLRAISFADMEQTTVSDVWPKHTLTPYDNMNVISSKDRDVETNVANVLTPTCPNIVSEGDKPVATPLFRLESPKSLLGVLDVELPTVVLMMYAMSDRAAEWFLNPNNDKNCQEVTAGSGIGSIYEGAMIDDFLFNSCGYSMNGLVNEGYFTIHITPETLCSYASFESNVPVPNYYILIQKVLQIFEPQRFTLTYMCPLAHTSASTCLTNYSQEISSLKDRKDTPFGCVPSNFSRSQSPHSDDCSEGCTNGHCTHLSSSAVTRAASVCECETISMNISEDNPQQSTNTCSGDCVFDVNPVVDFTCFTTSSHTTSSHSTSCACLNKNDVKEPNKFVLDKPNLDPKPKYIRGNCHLARDFSFLYCLGNYEFVL